jgi:hypothetical protein
MEHTKHQPAGTYNFEFAPRLLENLGPLLSEFIKYGIISGDYVKWDWF